MRIAKVKTITSSSELLVPITSLDKPEISDEIQKKWQQIVDLAAKIIGVPSGLITRLSEKQLEVFLTNNTPENIFEPNLKLDLGAGWYCENVVGTRKNLIVDNATKMEDWKDNPSVPFGMIAYMGIPIVWPDGEVFGTFCMLDNKENPYSELYIDLLKILRDIVQNDLKSILLYHKAQNDLINKEFQIREVHHQVKNHFNLLISTLSMQSFLKSDSTNEENLLSDIQSRIYAISTIHDKLYKSRELEEIYLGDYLNELGKYIIQNLSDKQIFYDCSGDNIIVGYNISLSCGLLLNELMTNSLKYAFGKTENPIITLRIEKKGQELYLVYKDNGIGISENFDIKNSNSLGMLLIEQNVLQLKGNYQISNERGFVFKMNFKFPKD